MWKPESVQEKRLREFFGFFFFLDKNGSRNTNKKTRLWANKKQRSKYLLDFAISTTHRVKEKENNKSDKYLVLARVKKAGEHEGDGDTDCYWCTWNGLQETGKEIGRMKDQRKNRDHTEHIITKIGSNTQ